MQLKKQWFRVAAVALGAAIAIGSVSMAEAAPTQAKPPAMTVGKSVPLPKQPGDAKVMAAQSQPKGTTQTPKLDATGKPATLATPKTGNNGNVDLGSTYNYCWDNFVYTPVVNHSGATQYYEIALYANGGYRYYYSSVGAYSTSYPGWYNITGTYYVYLYVWNGSSYAYDEYMTSSNNCSVTVSLVSSVYSGYVYMTVRNNGNAYATFLDQELAPYNSGVYYDSPAPGGYSVSRYFYVGTGVRYGVTSDVNGSTYNAFQYTGVY